jgi:predicted transcriptional regulator
MTIWQEKDMREILVGITDAQRQDLDRLAKQRKSSRAALIREAIDDLLRRRQRDNRADAFGLWGAAAPDGLEYQRRIRAEW